MKPTISIIIIVKNDRGIADTLAGLATQKRPVPTEIIVVDASEPSLMAGIRKQYPDVHWYQFVPIIPNKTSIPEQRNFGIRHAEGEIIVFIDANCVPSENWLVELTKPILDGSETMTAGSVRASNPKTRVNLNPVDMKSDYLSSSPTINLAFKKNLLDKVGEFDESFLFGSDVDFTWRCRALGNKIRFVRQATVTHDWGDFKDEIKRSFKYGRARAKLLIKHPERRYEDLLGDSLAIPVYTLYFIGLPLTMIVWWYPFTILVLMAKNIGQQPIKTVFLNSAYTLGFIKGILMRTP